MSIRCITCTSQRFFIRNRRRPVEICFFLALAMLLTHGSMYNTIIQKVQIFTDIYTAHPQGHRGNQSRKENKETSQKRKTECTLQGNFRKFKSALEENIDESEAIEDQTAAKQQVGEDGRIKDPPRGTNAAPYLGFCYQKKKKGRQTHDKF